MTEELEALVSHLYVVGGRAVSAPPPGALVQLAPPRVSRSRERDAIFVLVLPAGQRQAKALFYEQMARLAAERYFETHGGVTAGLREVLVSLNSNLLEHNTGHPDSPFYADVICLVLRQQEAYIARTGASVLLLWQGGALHTFPDPLDARQLSSGRPLGSTPEPDLKMTRYRVEMDDIAALCGPEIGQLSADELKAISAGGTLPALVSAFKKHDLAAANLLVMQFVAPEEPEVAAPVGAEAGPQPAETPAAVPAPAAAAVTSEPAQPAAPPVAEPGRRGLFGRRKGDSLAATSTHVSIPRTAASAPSRALHRWWRRSKAGRDSLAQAASDARPRLDTFQAESRNLFQRLWRGLLRRLHRIVLRLSAILGSMRRLLDKALPEPEPGKSPSLPTPIAAGAAMLIPIVVVLAVVAFSLSTRDETAFERCLSQANEAAGAAQLVEQTNPSQAQEAWFGVIEVANRCLPRRPNDPMLQAIRSEAQARLDRFARVVRCPAVLLRRYEAGANIRGPVLRNDVNLYTLDTTRSAVYRDELNEAGNALVQQYTLILRRGTVLGSYTVGTLVDIAWLTESGIARGSTLILLDPDGYLITYSPTFPPPTVEALQGTERWGRPVAMDTWQGRLYILDPPVNQIWRYQPAGGGFPSAPEEYFVGDQRPSLSGAVDLSIDQTGNVYVLFKDGTLRKYYSGEEQFFQFSNLPNGVIGSLGSASGFYLDTGLISPGFYILDADSQIIYETTLGGTFIQSYRAPESASFRDLSAITVDSSAEGMYVGARENLYYIAKCQ